MGMINFFISGTDRIFIFSLCLFSMVLKCSLVLMRGKRIFLRKFAL